MRFMFNTSIIPSRDFAEILSLPTLIMMMGTIYTYYFFLHISNNLILLTIFILWLVSFFDYLLMINWFI